MKVFFGSLLALFLLLTSCKKPSDNPVTPGDDKKINVGDFVDITTQSIGTGGGEITVSKPGDPLNGMKITIPSKSFTTMRNFSISQAQIKSHKFGDDFNPISPLIKIKYEGGYADSVMKLKIPIKLPTGHFAMGFFYDETTGKLEGLMLEDLTNDFITVSTRHFESKTKVSKSVFPTDEVSEGSLIIASILESKLAGHPVIATGFDPGYDDWEFPNWGSYISPNGHCAGQSITAIWYYYEKALRGAKDLFHGYDKICDKSFPPQYLWYDNPKGYRFSSVIQEELNFSGWMKKMDTLSAKPKNTFYSIINSMLKTGEPQLICIRRISPDTAGHAVVAYKIDPILKKIYVADPNFPGNRDYDKTSTSVRVIEFDGTNFLPYQSMDNVGNPISSFNQIGYFGKSTFIDMSKVKYQWTKVELGTIGDDKFPAYQIIDKTTGRTITETMDYDQETIKFTVRSTACDGIMAGTDYLQPFELIDTAGVTIETGDIHNYGAASVKLKPGINKFGIYIKGLKNVKGISTPEFVDFKWVTINYTEKVSVSITPNPFTGRVNTDYTFTATVTGIAPSNLKYVWNFQFGSDIPTSITKINENTVTYKFTKVGNYAVWMYLYDNSTGSLLASSSIVRPTIIAGADIFTTKSAGVYFTALWVFDNTNYTTTNFTIGQDYYIYHGQKMNWSGNDFSIDFNYKTGDMYDSVYYTGKVFGSVSADGNTINNITAELYTSTKSGGGLIRTQKITCTNLPVTEIGTYAVQSVTIGPQASEKVSSIQWFGRFKDYYTGVWENYTLTSVNYTSSTNLRISFSK